MTHDFSRQGCLSSEERSLVIKSVNIDDYRLRRTTVVSDRLVPTLRVLASDLEHSIGQRGPYKEVGSRVDPSFIGLRRRHYSSIRTISQAG